MTNLNKHVWEGWTIQSFIDELQPMLDMANSGQSIQEMPSTRREMEKYLKENQPCYKKRIPELVDYFCVRYSIK